MPPTSHNRAVVLIGLLIVLAIAAALFFYSNRAQAPETTPDATQNTENTTPSTENGTTTTEAPTDTQTSQPQTNTAKPAAAPTTKPAATKTPVPTYGAVISYIDGGFEPIRSTIFVGQTVRFVNNSDRDMWVASDIHPTHAGYIVKSEKDCLGSSFDQCKAVAKGGSWDFKFTAVGSWDYHNHMKATDQGTIYVVERE